MQSSVFPSWLSGRVELAPPLAFPFALRGRAVPAKSKPPRTASVPFVDSLDYEAAVALTAEWQALADRALEPNIFAEPTYALAAAQHFPGTHRPRFLFVWSGGPRGERGDLLAVCPIHMPGRFESRRLMRSWTHGSGQIAVPVVDAARATTAIDTLLAFVRSEMPKAAGFLFRGLPRHGATVALLQTLAHERGLACNLVTCRSDDLPPPVRLSASRERIAATLGPQRRDLEKLGPTTFRSATHPSDVRFAAEEFFALDAAARRGRSDAILAHPDVTTFSRALTRMLAARGQCRIDRLAVDDVPVAMCIVIAGREQDYVWKLAANPSFEEFGLDGQLLLAHARANPDARDLALIDHRRRVGPPVAIDPVWTDTVPLVDVALATSGERNRAVTRAVRRASLWRTARATTAG